jgi:hypothetical protein
MIGRNFFGCHQTAGAWQPVVLVDFLRLMPQKIPDYRAARTFGPNGLCRVKNRLIGDFLGFYA